MAGVGLDKTVHPAPVRTQQTLTTAASVVAAVSLLTASPLWGDGSTSYKQTVVWLAQTRSLFKKKRKKKKTN